MIMPIGLEELGQLGGYIILAEPFNLNGKVITGMKVIFRDDAGTCCSAIALKGL